MTGDIRFGTDGWRAVIGDDFTYENLGRVAQAAGAVFSQDAPGGTILVGYDTRFEAERFALHAARIIAAQGLRVLVSDEVVPTPALCRSVACDERAVGGIMLTASHNPAEYLGFKVRMADGGASPVAFTDRIEALLPASAPRATGEVERISLVEPYLTSLAAFVDAEAIRSAGLRVLVDPMYGAGQGLLARSLRNLGVDVTEVHGERNPGFGGLHPEPIPPWIDETRARVAAEGYDAAFFTDGDADRIGAADGSGAFVDPHRIIALVVRHLVEDRGRTGRVVKTLSTSVIVDRLARTLGLDVTTTPVGFKWIYEQMVAGGVLLGGEESGGIGIPEHVRERDGLLMAHLLVEMMAHRRSTLAALVEDLLALTGPREYRRIDLRVAPDIKEQFLERLAHIDVTTLAGRPVREILREDGIKFLLDDDAWLLLRFSGTEPLARVYAEAADVEAVDRLLQAGRDLVEGER